MPNFVSPGVYVIEKDISEYTPATNPSIVGMVGFADKGEPHKPTLITTPTQLVQAFGEPSEELPGQAIQGGLEVLAGPNGTNQLWFVRAIDTAEGTLAKQAAGDLSLGSCPALVVNKNIFGAGGGDVWIELTVTDDKNDFGFPEGTRTFHVPAPGLETQATALRAAIGGSLNSDKVGVFWDNDDTGTLAIDVAGGPELNLLSDAYGILVGFAAGSVASLTATAYSDSDKTTIIANAFTPMLGTGDVTLDETDDTIVWEDSPLAVGATYATGTLSYRAESLWPGAGYNEDPITGKGNAVATEALGSDKSIFYVYENGALLESFTVSLGSEVFIENVINTGTANAVSEVILGNLNEDGLDFDAHPILFTSKITSLVENVLAEGGIDPLTPRFTKFVEGGIGLAGGNSGATENIVGSLVGNSALLPKTGIEALDVEGVPITMAIVPGISDQDVQNALIALAERTSDFIAVIGTPLAVGNAQKAVDWHNGKHLRTTAINSSYAAIYYPSVKVFNPYLGRDIFMDPGIYGIKQMCYTDSVSDPWFAPAGFIRGRLLKPTEVEVDLSQGERDSLYSGGNAINPIVNFPQRGITIFGQRTAQRDPTALDRINVRRLLLVVKRVILEATQRFVFEPNDEITWEKVKATLEPFLDDIQRRRGITQFKVVCDETTNTPVRVDRNELWCKVLIKPTKTAEVIVFELNITNQSTNLS